MVLSVKEVTAAKGKEKPYKLVDEKGLYLHVASGGTKSWRYNYTEHGKQKTKNYGRYPQITLAEARRLHQSFKDYGVRDEFTFKRIAEDWLKVKLPQLSNKKHALQVAATLEKWVYPPLGGKLISDIKRLEIVAVIKQVEEQGLIETAHRVAQRVRAVFDYAVDMGVIDQHPAAGIARVLRKQTPKHQNAVAVAELPDLLRAIDSYPEHTTRIALLFLAHTFVRTTELRGMRWAELADADTWLIPAERMKKRVPHVVPLTPQTKALLAQLERVSDYVFASPDKPNSPISENTMLFALYRLGYRGRMTGHGFRALASTVLNQSGLWHADAIERQLAHQETNAVRAAYLRADYLDERRKMLAWWSEYLDKLQSTECV